MMARLSHLDGALGHRSQPKRIDEQYMERGMEY